MNAEVTPKQEGTQWSTDNMFGDLGFGSTDTPVEKKGRRISIVYIAKAFETLLTLTLISVVLLAADTFVRAGSEPVAFLQGTPLCALISRWIDGYTDTGECHTPASLAQSYASQQDALEKEIADRLSVYLPQIAQSRNIEFLPTVAFIKKQTGDERILLTDIFARLERILKNPPTGGLVQCEWASYSQETREVTLACTAYGAALTEVGKSNSSRIVAINFLKLANAKASGFEVVDPPQSLPISQYEAPDEDDITAPYKTQTTLSLRLRYLPISQRL